MTQYNEGGGDALAAEKQPRASVRPTSRGLNGDWSAVELNWRRRTKRPPKALPPVEPFYTLQDIVDMRVFGTKSFRTLQEVARLQTKDPRRYKAKLPMSWQAIHTYPRFVKEGGRWGLYASQIEVHRRKKRA